MYDNTIYVDTRNWFHVQCPQYFLCWRRERFADGYIRYISGGVQREGGRKEIDQYVGRGRVIYIKSSNI